MENNVLKCKEMRQLNGIDEPKETEAKQTLKHVKQTKRKYKRQSQLFIIARCSW